jgi:hypothetical protein
MFFDILFFKFIAFSLQLSPVLQLLGGAAA